jgi:hypothetical protein
MLTIVLAYPLLLMIHLDCKSRRIADARTPLYQAIWRSPHGTVFTMQIRNPIARKWCSRLSSVRLHEQEQMEIGNGRAETNGIIDVRGRAA